MISVELLQFLNPRIYIIWPRMAICHFAPFVNSFSISSVRLSEKKEIQKETQEKETERKKERGKREREREREKIYSPPRLSSPSLEIYAGSEWIRSTHLPPDNCSVWIALRSPPNHNIAPSKLPPINLFVRDVLYISTSIHPSVHETNHLSMHLPNYVL